MKKKFKAYNLRETDTIAGCELRFPTISSSWGVEQKESEGSFKGTLLTIIAAAAFILLLGVAGLPFLTHEHLFSLIPF